MTLILSGTDGLSDIDGSAATPAIRGTDANTGIFFPAADTIAFSEGGAEVARFDSSGNLGLGITNPTKKLSITGSSNDSNSGAIQTTNANAGTANQVGLWASNGTQSAQFSLAGTGYTAYGAYASGNAIIYNDQAITLMADNAATGIIKFAAGGNTERARIDSSGNFLVGTTSAGTDKVRFASAGASANQLGLVSTDDHTGNGYIQFRNSATTSIGSISRVGTTNAVAYNTTSDYRLKTVTGAVTGQGARIDALKPIDYLWTDGGQQARGFLAHEFQTVYLNSVTGTKDAVDADGNPVYQSMQAATSEVIADLVAEIQSLRTHVAQLQADVAALKAV
jgi:hypothetical protein